MNADLTTAYKGKYPFRLACPSFIYPAGYLDNVRRLCACVDEIELLLLESKPECLPGPGEIRELAAVGKNEDITFNIHLPTDVVLAAVEPEKEIAVDRLLRAIDLSRPLAPVSYTLHVPFTESAGQAGNYAGWQHRVRKSLERLLASSGLPAGLIAIETLADNLDHLDTVIREMGFSICLDTGHLMAAGKSCREIYRTWQQRIIIIHAHGVDNSRDHLALDRLPEAPAREIGHILSGFRHSLCLEVFTPSDLAASLNCLDRIWHNFQKSGNE